MDIELILNDKATIEDLIVLNGLGYEFLIENGHITGFWRG